MNKQLFYQQPASRVIEYFGVDQEQGISEDERKKRLLQYGTNGIISVSRRSLILKYLDQYKDLLVVLLIVSAVLAWRLNDMTTTIVLVALVIINTSIGFYQEAHAESALEGLKKLIHSVAKVRTGGELVEMPSADVVPGDIVFVQEGDYVPADIRIIEQSNLQTNDFALTGESDPKNKHTHEIEGEVELGDRTNLLFMGTTVAVGNGRGVVIGTGMDTQLGTIAQLTSASEEQTSPLQEELNNVATKITVGTVILFVALLVIALLRDIPVHDSLLFAIGIASAMVPQGLPAQISAALSSSALALARKGALVKRLSAVETLGAVNVICTDKTGTLTKNEMTVQRIVIGETEYQVSGVGYEPNGKITETGNTAVVITAQTGFFEKIFFEAGVLASTASIQNPDETHATWYTIGDPTEGALITLAQKAGIQTDVLREETDRPCEHPFDSVRKRMSCVIKTDTGYRVLVKGASQSMLPLATHVIENEQVRLITQEDKERYTAYDDTQASHAMRNLVFAYRDVATLEEVRKLQDAEKDLTILGMVCMIDPPREEVIDAVVAAHNAHIKTVVITGDYAKTAEAIAHMIQLVAPSEALHIISGLELRELGDQEVMQMIMTNQSVIFSRTSPEDKVRIVDLCKRTGMLVAVTGDGVNDAPALKRAHIGVAMGKTGTDVAKEAAEIVLLDDSFGTLVKAIQQGRVIFQNIQKTTISCITKNGGELGPVLAGLVATGMTGVLPAIQALQILAIDLMAEMAALIALAYDKPQEGIMEEQPRNVKKHMLRRYRIIDMIWSGLLLMGGLAFFAYRLWYAMHGVTFAAIDLAAPGMKLFYGQANVMTYLTIVLCQFANIMSRRAGDTQSVFTRYAFSNTKLLRSFGLGLLLVAHFIYAPRMNHYFGTAPLPRYGRVIATGCAIIFLLVREGYKKVCRGYIESHR